MILLPIDIDESKNIQFLNNPECISVLNVYPDYYKKVGFNKPWIGYFASIDDSEIVGTGGFKGQPNEGKVEIAYGSFKNHEGRGIGTEICRQLVTLALHANERIRITARTMEDGYASMTILKKIGFQCIGVVHDEEDGNVLEWEFKIQN
jgi:RimJ/RimL family protein N-acetyltransferase